MAQPTIRSAITMGLACIACAAGCGYLTTRGTPHLAAVLLIAALAFGITAACEFEDAIKRRQQRHAPFIRPALRTDDIE